MTDCDTYTQWHDASSFENMPSQLPRQTDGELAEYDGSLNGDQVFYTNIYFDILWKWIRWTKMVISAFICCFFNEGIFKGASNAEGSCEDWVSQPRRPWGEFFQLEPTVWHIAHQKSYNLDGVDLDYIDIFWRWLFLNEGDDSDEPILCLKVLPRLSYTCRGGGARLVQVEDQAC